MYFDGENGKVNNVLNEKAAVFFSPIMILLHIWRIDLSDSKMDPGAQYFSNIKCVTVVCH